MSLQGWQTLVCPKCAGKSFRPVFELIWQNGMGTSQRPAGLECVGCGAHADTAKMIAKAKAAEAAEKIKELEANLG